MRCLAPEPDFHTPALSPTLSVYTLMKCLGDCAMLITLLFLGGLIWMGQFIWFPDGDKLLALFSTDSPLPCVHNETWAMQLYRETFAPDCGYPWIPRLLVVSSWISWICVLLMAVVISLFIAGLLPKDAATSWALLGDLLLYLVTVLVMLVLVGMETWLLHRKGVSLRFRVRKRQWLASHPAPRSAIPNGRLPWWFWLDSGVSETLFRLAVFLGGFLASIAAILYVSRINSPSMITVVNFWDVMYCWALAVLWLPIPVTIWLSYLDWTYRDLEILLLWAGKQQ